MNKKEVIKKVRKEIVERKTQPIVQALDVKTIHKKNIIKRQVMSAYDKGVADGIRSLPGIAPIDNTTEIKEELVVDTSIIEKQYYDMGYVAGVSKTRENYNITIILVTLAILTVLAIYVSIK